MKAETRLGEFAASLFDLTGQVALVTGAGRGLGREMARALASAGATVICGGRDSGALEQTVTDITGAGGKAEALAFDLNDGAACQQAITAIADRHGRLDVLVNNAGVRNRSGFDGLTRADFASILMTNLVALTDLSRLAAAVMIAGGRGGRIINIGSIASLRGNTLDPSYVAAKAGLAGMTRSMANAWGRHGITVNEIAPGPFATEFNAGIVNNPEASRAAQSATIVGRWGRPDELCSAVLFLASPGSGFITGQQIVVDGGLVAKA